MKLRSTLSIVLIVVLAFAVVASAASLRQPAPPVLTSWRASPLKALPKTCRTWKPWACRRRIFP